MRISDWSSDVCSSDLLRLAVSRVGNELTVLAGTGLSSTAKTIRLSQHVRELGAAAALVVTPAYVRPTQEGLYQHFVAGAEHAGRPMEFGRGSLREEVWRYVKVTGVDGSLKQKQKQKKKK